jgi:hypothetical protein
VQIANWEEEKREGIKEDEAGKGGELDGDGNGDGEIDEMAKSEEYAPSVHRRRRFPGQHKKEAFRIYTPSGRGVRLALAF